MSRAHASKSGRFFTTRDAGSADAGKPPRGAARRARPEPRPGVEPLETRVLFVAGELDFQFSTDGKAFADYNAGAIDTARAVAVQADGKVVAVGDWDGGFADFAVVRFDQGGNPDPTFSTDGRQNLTFGAAPFGGVERATAVAIQPDGRIVVAGYTDAGTTGGLNVNDFAVARFNPDGTLDNTFNLDGKFTFNFGGDDRASAVLLQPDGKILVGGTWDGGSADMVVLRLNANGTVDNTFSFNGWQNVNFGGASVDRASAMALHISGDIFIAGHTNFGTTGGANTNDFAVARLNVDGTIDNGFSADGRHTIDFGYDDRAAAVAVDRLNRVVLAGADDGGAADFALARLTYGGALDTTFNDVASPTNWNGDGKLSFTFSAGPGPGGVERARAIALEPHGFQQEIYVAGVTDAGAPGTGNNFALARVRPDGKLDTSFGGGDGKQITDMGGANDDALGLALGADGKPVVSGITAGPVAGNFAVARYLGELDPAFGFDGKVLLDWGAVDTARAVAVQPNGRIVVAGDWDGGSADFAIARMTTTGALDTTFSADGRVNLTFGAGLHGGVERATAVALQSDGRIVVAGYTDAGTTGGVDTFDFAVARLNADGSLDSTFSGDGKFTFNWGHDDRVHAIAIQPDGKIVLVGQWAGNAPDFALMRLNPDGTLDTRFGSGGRQNVTFGAGAFGGDERANAVALAPDGDIWVAGYTDANGTAANPRDFAVARFNADGSVDTAFNDDGRFTIDFGGDDQATGIALRPDGRLVVGGFNFDITSDFAVAQIRDNGLDAAFGGGDGMLEVFTNDLNEYAHGLALLENGKILMVGRSDSGTSSANNFAVARVLANGSGEDPTFNADGNHFVDFGADDRAYAVAIDAERRPIVVGISGSNFAVARYDSAPAVRQVYVNSSAWTPAFRSYLQANGLGSVDFGYAIPAGLAQLTSLPWNNINEVTIAFTDFVDVNFPDLAMRGVNTPTYAFDAGIGGFVLFPSARAATWRMPAGAVVQRDRLTLDLDGDSIDAVKTALGAVMDGDWQSGFFETYPSGDGAAGGDFRFAVNVLPGDVDRANNRVNSTDVTFVRSRQNRILGEVTPPGVQPYTPFADINGDGRINAVDVTGVRARLNHVLPTPPLVPLASPAPLFSDRPLRFEEDAGSILLG